jgi:hypothetical protein
MKKVYDLPETYDAIQLETDVRNAIEALEEPPREYYIGIDDDYWSTDGGPQPAKLGIIVKDKEREFDFSLVKNIIDNHQPAEKKKARKNEEPDLLKKYRKLKKRVDDIEAHLGLGRKDK